MAMIGSGTGAWGKNGIRAAIGSAKGLHRATVIHLRGHGRHADHVAIQRRSRRGAIPVARAYDTSAWP